MIINRDGVKLFYEIEGDGLPCLVPTLANHSIYSNTFSPGIREHLRLAFCHLRGTAKSTWLPVDDLTIGSAVEDLDTVRQELGLERVAVLGHSGHSYFALDYARLHPDETAAVILIGPSPAWRGSERGDYWKSFASDERKQVLSEQWARLSEEDQSGAASGEAWVRRYVAMGPRYWYEPRFDASALWGDDPAINIAFFDRFWGNLFPAYDHSRTFAEIACPVFIAVGRYDFASVPAIWEEEAKKFPHAECHVFERSGHFPMYEEQELFDRRLIDWLRRTGSV